MNVITGQGRDDDISKAPQYCTCTRSPEDTEAEHWLWVSVITRAILDLFDRHSDVRDDAWNFLVGPDLEPVAKAAGLEPDKIDKLRETARREAFTKITRYKLRAMISTQNRRDPQEDTENHG